jgi:hypothetical protein
MDQRWRALLSTLPVFLCGKLMPDIRNHARAVAPEGPIEGFVRSAQGIWHKLRDW